MRASGLSGRCFLLLAAIVGGSAWMAGAASAASVNCPPGETSSSGACAKPGLASTTQRATLALAQSQINHNFCPYLPANSNVERLYPAHDVVFSQRLN